jgi:hypothetical protein
MKLPSKKYLFVTLVIAASGLTTMSDAFASITGSPISQLLQQQVLSVLPPELTGLVDGSGNINLDRTLTTISKQGADTAAANILKNGSVTAPAGQVSNNLTKDEIEVASSANSKSHQDSLDEFKAANPKIEQVTSDNETASSSSLEAADKANQLNSTLVSSTQRQIKSTNDLTTAVQINNANTIRQSQEDRVKQMREQVNIATYQQDVVNTRAVFTNRYYPDGTGGVTKVTDNRSVAAFGGK